MTDNTSPYPLRLEAIAKLSALIAGVLYVSGFLIINSYLAKYGVNDYNVINSRFVFAGASFYIACLIWWLICGRLYIFQHLLQGYWSEDTYYNTSMIFRIAATALLLARSVTASLTICLVMFGSGMIVLPCFLFVAALMGIEALISNSRRIRIRFPFLADAARLLLSSAAIFLFFAMFYGKEDVSKVFYLMMSLEAVGLPLGAAIRDNKLFDLRPAISPIYNTMMTALYMISFGSQFFDKISAQYGGGLTHKITVNLKDPLTLPGISMNGSNMLSGVLLYSNDKILLVSTSYRNLMISQDQVKASIIDTKPDQLNEYKMVKSVRRLGINWRSKAHIRQTLISLEPTYATTPNMTLKCYYDWQYVCNMPLMK